MQLLVDRLQYGQAPLCLKYPWPPFSYLRPLVWQLLLERLPHFEVFFDSTTGFGATTTPTTTGVILSHPGIAKGGGVVEGDGSGILGVGADGEDLRMTSEVPTTGSIDVVVSYHTIES